MSVQADICSQLEPLLDSYHDNELDAGERQRVEAHLADCQLCTARLQDIGRLVASLKSLPPVESKPDFDAFMQRVEAASQSTQTNKKVIAGPWPLAAAVAAAAAVALLVLTFWARAPQLATNPPESSQSPAPVVAENPTTTQPKVPAAPETNPVEHNVTKQGQESPIKTAFTSPAAVSTSHQEPLVTGKSSATNSNVSEPGKQKSEPAQPQQRDSARQHSVEIAELPDPNTSFNDDLGLETDEDGLYAINI